MDNIVNITELAEGAIAKVISDGVIEKKIQEAVEKTVSDIVKDMFSSWSDFGKSLKEQVSQKMKIDFSRLNLPVYNEYVLALIEGVVKQELIDKGYAGIAEHVRSILGDTLKAEYKLTEVVEILKKEFGEYKDPGDEFSVHIENSGNGYRWVSFDEDENKKKHECGYRIGINEEGKIFSLSIGERDYGSYTRRAASIVTTKAFGEFLVRAKAQGVKIEMDEDEDYIDKNYFDED